MADGHDPMCDLYAPPNHPGSWGCQCALIARVRADERAKVPVHSTGTDTGGPCCECCHDVYRLRAERDAARDRVRALELSCSIWAKQDTQWRDEIEGLFAERDRLRTEVADLSARWHMARGIQA